MKRILAAALAFLLLCGCGGDVTMGYVFHGYIGENVSVELKVGDDYDLRYKGSTFYVLKEKKEILEGSIVPSSDWEETAKLLDSGTVEVIEKSDERMTWKEGDLYKSICPAGIADCALVCSAGSEISREEFNDALNRLSYRPSDEKAVDSLDF